MINSTDISKQADAIAANVSEEIITSLVLNGDISKMSQVQKVEYYNTFCRALTLNPITQPFEIINLNGKLRMYATKGCTDQLRRVNGISITDIETKQVGDTYIVIAKGQDRTGRIDSATGALNIKGLSGDALANAIMKCETKAKRRLTLSLSGLGILDETELDTIPTGSTTKTNDQAKQDHKAATPNAPEIALAVKEDLNALLEWLDNENLPETIFQTEGNQKGVNKKAMKAAIEKKFADGKLAKDKAEEYIAGLKAEVDKAVAEKEVG